MTDREYTDLRARIDVADEIFGDLPDGAYWAACEEQGVGTDVQIAVDEYEEKHGLGVHASNYPRNNNKGPFAPF